MHIGSAPATSNQGGGFHPKQSAFQANSARRRVAAQTAAGSHDAVTGDDQRNAVQRHAVTHRTSRTRKARPGSQLSVSQSGTEGYLPTMPVDSPLEVGQGAQVDLDVEEIIVDPAGVGLQSLDETKIPLTKLSSDSPTKSTPRTKVDQSLLCPCSAAWRRCTGTAALL